MNDEDRAKAMRALEEGGSGGGTDPLRRIHAALRAFAPASRSVCPPRTLLVEYHDQALAAEEAARVMAHVETCPFCAADLADLEALCAPPLFEAVVAVGANALRLVRHTFTATAQPAMQPARGTAGGGLELRAEHDDMTVTMRVRPTSAGRADVRVALVAEAPIDRARVNLERDDRLLESRVTTTGEVTFAEVMPGDYTVTLAPSRGDEWARVALRLEPDQGPVA